MIHYGEDLKEKLRLGLVKDLEAATHHIAEARSEWLLRIAPVYNVSSLWLNDAVDYAKKAGIYRFGVKHSMKFADRYIEGGIKEVVRYAMDSEGQKFLLDFFDNSEDVMRSNTQGLYYPIYNYISKLGFKHLDVCAALGVSLSVAEITIKAESQLQEKWREAWGYTVPLIVDMRKFPDLLRNVIGGGRAERRTRGSRGRQGLTDRDEHIHSQGVLRQDIRDSCGRGVGEESRDTQGAGQRGYSGSQAERRLKILFLHHGFFCMVYFFSSRQTVRLGGNRDGLERHF